MRRDDIVVSDLCHFRIASSFCFCVSLNTIWPNRSPFIILGDRCHIERRRKKEESDFVYRRGDAAHHFVAIRRSFIESLIRILRKSQKQKKLCYDLFYFRLETFIDSKSYICILAYDDSERMAGRLEDSVEGITLRLAKGLFASLAPNKSGEYLGHR